MRYPPEVISEIIDQQFGDSPFDIIHNCFPFMKSGGVQAMNAPLLPAGRSSKGNNLLF